MVPEPVAVAVPRVRGDVNPPVASESCAEKTLAAENPTTAV
jgi:hypothetical protein